MGALIGMTGPRVIEILEGGPFPEGVQRAENLHAHGLIDDIVALATGKVPMLASGSLGTNPLFQHELATADTELRAARALAYELAEAAWHQAVSGDEPTLTERAHARAAGVWVTGRAAAVVETAKQALAAQ